MGRTLLSFQNKTRECMQEIIDAGDEKRIFKVLGQEDPEFARLNFEVFKKHYLAARLALVSLVWEKVCSEHQIEGESRRAFLKRVMDTFQTPDTIPFATLFSEFRCASDLTEEEDLLPSLIRLMFDRLGISPALKMSEQDQMIRPSAHLVAGALDALRVAQENHLTDWILLGQIGESR
jgi:hypothetical protein